jgi:dTDP-L-rhamnose 4-epimerase
MFDRAPLIYEDGRQVRDFVNIDDAVAANLLVLDHPSADFQVFNVGGGTAWTVAQFYESMQQVVGKRLDPAMEGLYSYGDTRHIFSDTRRLQALGWRARRTVQESIAAYWDYLTTHQERRDILAHAEQQMRRLDVIRKSGKP